VSDLVHHLIKSLRSGLRVAVTEVAHHIRRDYELTMRESSGLIPIDASGEFIFHPIRRTVEVATFGEAHEATCGSTYGGFSEFLCLELGESLRSRYVLDISPKVRFSGLQWYICGV